MTRAIILAALALVGCARCSSTPAPTSPDPSCEAYAVHNHLDVQRACYGDAAVQGGDAGVTGR